MSAEKKPTTFREHIQDLIREIWVAYDKVSPLRDFAGSDEKQPFNDARGNLYKAAIALSNLDNALTDQRAATKL